MVGSFLEQQVDILMTKNLRDYNERLFEFEPKNENKQVVKKPLDFYGKLTYGRI